MSIFITNLAYDDPLAVTDYKISIRTVQFLQLLSVYSYGRRRENLLRPDIPITILLSIRKLLDTSKAFTYEQELESGHVPEKQFIAYASC